MTVLVARAVFLAALRVGHGLLQGLVIAGAVRVASVRCRASPEAQDQEHGRQE
jgi:hypothetical protein